jgi:hypothetical protein
VLGSRCRQDCASFMRYIVVSHILLTVINAISMRSRGGGGGSIEALRLHAAMCV